MSDLCVNGHDDWYVKPNGKRRCRTCARERRNGERPKAPMATGLNDPDGSIRLAERTYRDENGCLIWTGVTNAKGYGTLRIRGRMQSAHRQAWENVNSPIPEGLQIDHLCRTRACVNTDHLEPVTGAENVRRGVESRGPRTTCTRGHDLTDETNVRTYKDGARRCWQCWLEAQRRRRYPGPQRLVSRITPKGRRWVSENVVGSS